MFFTESHSTISTNLKFISLEFDTTTTMETFCHEPLNIAGACQVNFCPDYNKRKRKPPKHYTIISFFNIPAEVDLKLLTDFLDQFASMEGEWRYATNTCKDIQYKKGTITYKVANTLEHTPRYNTLFGRNIKYYYNGQSKPTKGSPRTDHQPDQDENNEIDTQVFTMNNPDNNETVDDNDKLNIQANNTTK